MIEALNSIVRFNGRLLPDLHLILSMPAASAGLFRSEVWEQYVNAISPPPNSHLSHILPPSALPIGDISRR
jgi:hypothetical protein